MGAVHLRCLSEREGGGGGAAAEETCISVNHINIVFGLSGSRFLFNFCLFFMFFVCFERGRDYLKLIYVHTLKFLDRTV